MLLIATAVTAAESGTAVIVAVAARHEAYLRHLSSDTALAVALLAIELGTKQAAIPFLGELHCESALRTLILHVGVRGGALEIHCHHRFRDRPKKS